MPEAAVSISFSADVDSNNANTPESPMAKPKPGMLSRRKSLAPPERGAEPAGKPGLVRRSASLNLLENIKLPVVVRKPEDEEDDIEPVSPLPAAKTPPPPRSPMSRARTAPGLLNLKPVAESVEEP
jgi:hypothetical protein